MIKQPEPYSHGWQCHGSSRRDCPPCVRSIPTGANAARLLLLIGDSLDRSVVWRSCEAEKSYSLKPLCGCKNCFACGPLSDGTVFANLFLVGLLTPQQQNTPGALLPSEPPLAQQRMHLLLPEMLANVSAALPTTVLLAPGSWDALAAGEDRPAVSALKTAFEDGKFARACRQLISEARAAFRKFSSARLLWHSAPAPHDARSFFPHGSGSSLDGFARRMQLTSSVGTAEACSAGLGLLDWRGWSCRHADYRQLATGQHYNATGSLLLADMLRKAHDNPNSVANACRATHPFWDTTRGCCVSGVRKPGGAATAGPVGPGAGPGPGTYYNRSHTERETYSARACE